jgi:hypothetical protein
MASAVGPTVRFRSMTTQVLGVCAMAFGALAVGSLVYARAWSSLASYGAVCALVGLFGWSALWAAYVEVSDGGVVLRNVLRTIRLPWPAITDVDGRYGLRLDTAYGRRFTGWAAPAPTGRARARGEESEVAALVRSRLDALRGAGYLERPRLEAEHADVRWHVPEIVAAAVLSVSAVVALIV